MRKFLDVFFTFFITWISMGQIAGAGEPRPGEVAAK